MKVMDLHSTKQNKMRTYKSQNSLSNKLFIFVCSFFLFLALVKLGLIFSSSALQNLQTNYSSSSPSVIISNKIPPFLAESLVHYATSNFTPQQTLQELSITLRVLEKKSPCNFLVFGLGNDSLMWSSLNYGGRTVFLEENDKWLGAIKKDMPSMEAYHVGYDTKVSQASQLLQMGKEVEECKLVEDPRTSNCRLAIRTFPNEIYDTEWDLIMVDAPTGFHDDLPGRMSAIYTAGLMARGRKEGETHVFVHDVDRWVENKFSMAFLCEGYWKEEVGKLRHFIIPSHFGRPDLPFCP